MGTELFVNVSCFEFNEFCNPEMVEIFNELIITNGCNPFRIDCKFAVAVIGNELVVIVGCLVSNNVDKPETVEIFIPLTTPFKVALLHIKFPDVSTEKVEPAKDVEPVVPTAKYPTIETWE